MIDDLRRAASANPQIQRDVLNTLRNIADLMKTDDVAVAIMERIVDVAPGDIDTRFSLAYKHSEIGNDDMAFYHYLKIPSSERKQIVWNNLGVTYNEFGMSAKAVRSYRRAVDLGETLAMSNLGHKFMEAGFLKEAQEEFDKAVAKKDYHKNVNLGLARLRDIPDEEEKKEQELLAGVKRKADFYKVLGLAVSQPTPSNLSTRWQGPECELHVSMSGNKVRAIGSYEKEASSGLMALSSNSKTTAKYQIEYEGTLDGRVIDGTVQRTRQGDGSVYTALGIGDPKTKVLIAIDDGGVLRAIENPHGMTPGYYELRSI